MNLTQTIEKVENLINTEKGDPGRLYHIQEFLKNGKSLYNFDKIYLENMLNSSFSVEEHMENPLLSKTQELIDSGNGDLGRLQHIYEMLEKNKPLYNSDQVYLELKLFTLIKKPKTLAKKPQTKKTRKKSVTKTLTKVKK